MHPFIVSHRSNTWYFANNNNCHFSFGAAERFLPFYRFADEANKKITHLERFVERFLAKCAQAEMISRHMVLVVSRLLRIRQDQPWLVQRIAAKEAAHRAGAQLAHRIGQQQRGDALPAYLAQVHSRSRYHLQTDSEARDCFCQKTGTIWAVSGNPAGATARMRRSMHEYWRALRLFSPSLRRFLFSSALVTLVAFGLAAVLQNLYMLRLGFDAGFIGLVLGVGQLVWAATALPAGLVSGRVGLRWGIQAGIALYGLGLALLLLVEWQPAEVWGAWLIGSQAIAMMGVALITVNNIPYLMAITGEAERRHAFAIFQALGPATAFLGSVVAGLLPAFLAEGAGLSLDQPGPYRLALLAAPVFCLLAVLPLFGAERVRGELSSESVRVAQPAPLSLLLVYGAIIFLHATGEGAARIFFNVYLDSGLGVPPAEIGSIMGVAQLLPIVAALSVPLLLARWGTGYTLLFANVGVGLLLVPFVLGPQVLLAAVAYMGVLAMSLVMGTSRDFLGQQLVVARWRTAAQAVVVIGVALGWATIGVAGGWLIEQAGFYAMYLAATVATFCSAGVLVVFLRSRRHPTPKDSSVQS